LFLTFYLQEVKGYSPVTSGLAFLPMIACILTYLHNRIMMM
jgi:hypothetical protein